MTSATTSGRARPLSSATSRPPSTMAAQMCSDAPVARPDQSIAITWVTERDANDASSVAPGTARSRASDPFPRDARNAAPVAGVDAHAQPPTLGCRRVSDQLTRKRSVHSAKVSPRCPRERRDHRVRIAPAGPLTSGSVAARSSVTPAGSGSRRSRGSSGEGSPPARSPRGSDENLDRGFGGGIGDSVQRRTLGRQSRRIRQNRETRSPRGFLRGWS
jgi:hypothetical protein